MSKISLLHSKYKLKLAFRCELCVTYLLILCVFNLILQLHFSKYLLSWKLFFNNKTINQISEHFEVAVLTMFIDQEVIIHTNITFFRVYVCIWIRRMFQKSHYSFIVCNLEMIQTMYKGGLRVYWPMWMDMKYTSSKLQYLYS